MAASFVRPLFVLVLSLSTVTSLSAAPPVTSASTSTQDHFVENVGQWDDVIRFRARCGTETVWVTDSGLRLELTRANERTSVQLGFGRARAVDGADGRAARYHWLLGRDASDWATDARTFGAVVLREVQPGIDVRLRLEEGRPVYDVEVAPGRIGDVVVHVDGASNLWIDETDGALVIESRLGAIRQPPARCYAAGVDDGRRPIESRYDVLDATSFVIETGERAPGERLVIDPTLLTAVTFGGTGIDAATDVCLDGLGDLFLTGQTQSSNFPVTPGALDTTLGGASDAFVAKLDATTLSVKWITYLGGSGDDRGRSVRVVKGGTPVRATVAGWTESTDFPATAGAFDTTANGGRDLFLARLNAAGNGLVFATYLGGSGVEAEEPNFDDLRRIPLAVDATGATIASTTKSTQFPTTPGAFQSILAGGADIVVARFDNQGGLRWSTLVGGLLDDQAGGIAIRADGVTFVAGTSDSPNFPLSASSPAGLNGIGSSGVLVRIHPTGIGADFTWALPPPSDPVMGTMTGRNVRIDPQGAAVVTAQALVGFGPNEFHVREYVVRLDATGTQVTNVVDEGAPSLGLAVHTDGSLFTAGDPCCVTVSSPQAFFWRTGKNGVLFEWISVGKNRRALAIDVGPDYVAYCVTRFSLDPLPVDDASIARIQFCRGRIDTFSDACPASPGFESPRLTATGCPAPGATLSLLMVRDGTEFSQAWLLIGAGPGTTPVSPTCSLSIGGIAPVAVPFQIDLTTATLSGMLPATTPIGAFHVQAYTVDPGGTPSASNSMRIDVQL